MEHNRIREISLFVAGALTGAAAIYLADLDRDGHRLRMAAQRAARPGRELADSVRSRGRDVRNRAQGLLASATSRFREDDVSDETLAQRVRAELGHHSEHASLVQVRAERGVVHLAGDLDDGEVERLGTVARHVRGVRDVAVDARPDARDAAR